MWRFLKLQTVMSREGQHCFHTEGTWKLWLGRDVKERRELYSRGTIQSALSWVKSLGCRVSWEIGLSTRGWRRLRAIPTWKSGMRQSCREPEMTHASQKLSRRAWGRSIIFHVPQYWLASSQRNHYSWDEKTLWQRASALTAQSGEQRVGLARPQEVCRASKI